MTQTESDGSIVDAWTENPVATAVAVGLGIVIGAGAVIGYFSIMATGDEPPIRVRNGSIQMEVLHSSRHWKPVGNDGMTWKLSAGVRLVDPYWLYLAPTAPADCGNTGSVNGKIVRYILDDGTWVQAESKNKKTEVTSSKPLTRSADYKTLSYGAAANYIKEIQLDGVSLCNFSQKDVKLQSLLTE